ncbi:MAG: hypothetical protein R3E10_17180 [Gemmatimonadota bacterium]
MSEAVLAPPEPVRRDAPRRSSPAGRVGALPDLPLALLVAALGFGWFLLLSSWFDPRMLGRPTLDAWFQADVARVFENMTQRWSNHGRTSHHPAFSLIGYTPTFALMHAAGLDAVVAVRLVIAALGGALGGLVFLSLRCIGLGRLEALTFTGVALTSASAVCWFTVPETFPFGSVAIALGVFTVAAGVKRVPQGGWDVLASAAMLATTKTNWAIGMLASFARHGWRRVGRIAVNAFAVVVILWSVQDWIFPDTNWFLARRRLEEAAVFPADGMGLWGVIRSMFGHTMVFPAIAVVDVPNIGEWPLLLTQRSGLGSSGLLGGVATAGWFVLLAVGLYTALRAPEHRRLGAFLVLAIGSQVVLHSVFGDETFLYSAHFLPLLVVLAALALRSPWRRPLLAVAAVVLVTNAANSVSQYRQATGFIDEWGAYHHSLRAGMAERPLDRWQRNESVGFSAGEGLDGAWYGPGGSGYPAAGTFGLNLWVRDALADTVIATSNDIPLESINEQPIEDQGRKLGWVSHTPWYTTRWRALAPRSFEFSVTGAQAPLDLVVRGIAPRDPGPLRDIRIEGDTLILNERWRMAPVTGPIYLGTEAGDWMEAEPVAASVSDAGGWAYARIPLDHDALQVKIWDPDASGPRGRILGWIRGG